MTNPSVTARCLPTWQQELADAISDPAELLQRLELPTDLLGPARAAAHAFRLRVPEAYLARMRPGDANDPLLRQVLPLGAELDTAEGYVSDPVGDLDAMTTPGLLHKYHGRALLVTTGACAVHCRYCFRRHFPYGDANPAREEWAEAIGYLAADDSIQEVILSGGDPMVLGNARLARLVHALEAIPHIRRLRIHSRLPVVLPSRIDAGLAGLLAGTRLKTVVVIHANHAREFDATVGMALEALRDAGAQLLNQAVLLRGVNDSVDAQAALSETLFEHGVMPYYLHLLDPVAGARHFDVPESEALQLLEGLRGRLPGYLVPRLVREIAGEASKRPVG